MDTLPLPGPLNVVMGKTGADEESPTLSFFLASQRNLSIGVEFTQYKENDAIS